MPDQLDRCFVADRTGHDDEGRVRAPLLRDPDGALAREARQGEVGQDHVRAEGVDLLLVGGRRVDNEGSEVQARAGQETLLEFSVGRIVLEDEMRSPPRPAAPVPSPVPSSGRARACHARGAAAGSAARGPRPRCPLLINGPPLVSR